MRGAMNGFDEPYWNLLQVLAWVWLRDRDTVAKAGDGEGRWGGSFFQEVLLPPDGEIKMIESSAGAFSHMTLCLLGAGLGQHGSIENREAEIHDALKDGRLKGYGIAKDAFGVVKGDGDLRLISPLEWSRLHFSFPLEKAPSAAAPTGTEWHDLKFPHAQVMACWPDPLAADQVGEDQATKVEPEAQSRSRKPEKQVELKARLEGALAYAREWPRGKPYKWIATQAIRQGKAFNFDTESLRKIYAGRYRAMDQFGLKGIYE